MGSAAEGVKDFNDVDGTLSSWWTDLTFRLVNLLNLLETGSGSDLAFMSAHRF